MFSNSTLVWARSLDTLIFTLRPDFSLVSGTLDSPTRHVCIWREKKVWKKCWFAFIAGSVLCAVTSASLSRERLDMSTPFVAFHVSSWRCGTFFYSTPLYHSESLYCDLSIPLRISKQRRLSHKTSRRICYSFKPCRQARSSFDGSRIVCFMFENVPRISRCFVVLVCLHTPSLYAHRAYDDGNQ